MDTCYAHAMSKCLFMYSTCTVHVHHVYNAKVPELEKLIFITCKSADSGKMLVIWEGNNESSPTYLYNAVIE